MRGSGAAESTDEAARREPSGRDDVLWPLLDHQNTVRDLAVYDAASDETTVASHRVFDAFGRLLTEPDGHLFAFTARPLDSSTGLQNNLHRWYDPSIAEWISEDPLGVAAGDGNLYRYCGNDPVNAVDPEGLETVTIIHRTTPQAATSIVSGDFRVGRGSQLLYFAEIGAKPEGVDIVTHTIELHVRMDLNSVVEIPASAIKECKDSANAALKGLGLSKAERASRFGLLYNLNLARWMHRNPGVVFRYAAQNEGYYYAMKEAGRAATKMRLMRVVGKGAKEVMKAVAARVASELRIWKAKPSEGKLPLKGGVFRGVARGLGRMIFLVAAGADAWDIYTAGNRLKVATEKIAGWAGGSASARVAAPRGAVLFGRAGVWGATTGGVVFGVGGFMIGYCTGETIVRKTWEYFEEPGIEIAFPQLASPSEVEQHLSLEFEALKARQDAVNHYFQSLEERGLLDKMNADTARFEKMVRERQQRRKAAAANGGNS